MSSENHVTFDPTLPRHKPILTKYLITLIIIVYILEVYYNAIYSDKTVIFLGAKWNEGITNGQLWRLVTYSFLHGNLLHLVLNIVAINIFGKEVESIYGNFKFLLIYLVSVWGSGLSSYYFSPGLAIGASGGVFGVLGSLIIYFYKQRDAVSGAKLRLKSIYTLAIINILLGFTIPRIDNFGHIGGILTGLSFSWLITPEYEFKTTTPGEKLKIFEKKISLKTILLTIIYLLLLYLITNLCIQTFKGN